ncbi:unnamed protein product [Phytophthora fragariaefolia]|uniref:Unnamed protein product n=1 Tax=Phytophthora fragariaefolia TaxID=1490495 RepID=A0A9W6XD92_9STRA|nr:unnamed protein product [Phytophthora fragariaefolia]
MSLRSQEPLTMQLRQHRGVKKALKLVSRVQAWTRIRNGYQQPYALMQQPPKQVHHRSSSSSDNSTQPQPKRAKYEYTCSQGKADVESKVSLESNQVCRASPPDGLWWSVAGEARGRRSAYDDSLARITNDSQGAEYDDKSDESVYGVNGEDGVMNDRVDRRGRYRGDQRDDDGQDRSEAGEDSLDGKDDNRSSETDSED